MGRVWKCLGDPIYMYTVIEENVRSFANSTAPNPRPKDDVAETGTGDQPHKTKTGKKREMIKNKTMQAQHKNQPETRNIRNSAKI